MANGASHEWVPQELSFIYFIIAWRQLRPNGFLTVLLKKDFKSLSKLSLNNATQAFLFALSYNVLYKFIAGLGSREMAAAGIIFNFALVCYLPGIAFGLVATSLVGQSIGKNEIDKAHSWASKTAQLSSLSLGLMSIPMFFFPDALLGFFILDAGTVELSRNALRLLAVSLFVEGYALVKMHALLGAGDSKRVFYISTFIQWLIYIPLARLLAHYCSMGLSGVWASNLLVQILLALIYGSLWKQGKWKKIKI